MDGARGAHHRAEVRVVQAIDRLSLHGLRQGGQLLGGVVAKQVVRGVAMALELRDQVGSNQLVEELAGQPLRHSEDGSGRLQRDAATGMGAEQGERPCCVRTRCCHDQENTLRTAP